MKIFDTATSKRGLSDLIIYMGGAIMAAILVLSIVAVVRARQSDNQRGFETQQGVTGVSVLSDASVCDGGLEVADLQGLVSRVGSAGTQSFRYNHLYQISRVMDESVWSADFTGDGDADDVIRQIPLDERNASYPDFASMLRGVSGGIVIRGGTDFISHSDKQSFVKGADSETLVMSGFYGGEQSPASQEEIVLAFDYSSLPNNVNSPDGVRTLIPIPSNHDYSSLPDLSFKISVFANPVKGCWYFKYTGDKNYVSANVEQSRTVEVDSRTKTVDEDATISGEPYIVDDDVPCVKLYFGYSGIPVRFAVPANGVKKPKASFSVTCVDAVSVTLSIDFVVSGVTSTEQVVFDIPRK